MTQDEIIAMAREAGAIRRYWGDNKEGFAFESDEQLERFAALVAEAERNRIEKVCYKIYDDDIGGDAWDCVKAIREMK